MSSNKKSDSDNLLDHYIDTDEIYRKYYDKKDILTKSRNLIKHLYETYDRNQLSAIKYSVEVKLQKYEVKSSSMIGLSAMSISSFAILISAFSSGSIFSGLIYSGLMFLVFIVVLCLTITSLCEKRKVKRETDNLEIMLVCINQAQLKQDEQSKLNDLKVEYEKKVKNEKSKKWEIGILIKSNK